VSEDDLDALSPYGRFLHHCAQGELAFQRSSAGEALFFRLVDPADGTASPQWAISQGLGRVYSVTIVHHRNETPFALALIELDEGFRMMSRIDADEADAVAIGARVRVGFRSLAKDEPMLPVFSVVERAA
jgi:uncharacterized OB-fold protein